MGPAQSIILGSITGVGGGMLRDVLLLHVPTVLRHGLYAVPALLGAAVVVLGRESGSTSPLFPVLGVMVCVAVRLIGVARGVRLPSAASRDG